MDISVTKLFRKGKKNPTERLFFLKREIIELYSIQVNNEYEHLELKLNKHGAWAA